MPFAENLPISVIRKGFKSNDLIQDGLGQE
jgi:hypothetical protein